MEMVLSEILGRKKASQLDLFILLKCPFANPDVYIQESNGHLKFFFGRLRQYTYQDSSS